MMLEKILMTLACACVFLGCHEQKSQEDLSTPASYMKDTAFRKKLAERGAYRDNLLATRMRLDEQLQAAKAKDPASAEVKSLQQRLDDCDAEFERNRKETYAIVRERLNRKDGGKK